MLNAAASSGYDQKPEIDLQQFSASAAEKTSSETRMPANDSVKPASSSVVSKSSPPPTQPPSRLNSSSTSGGAPSRRQGSKKWKKIALIVLVLVVFFAAVGGALGFYTYSTAMTLRGQATEAEQIGRETYDAFKTQNLPGTQEGLNRLEGKLAEIRSTYNKLGFYRFVPIASAYYNDGVHGLNAADAALAAGKKGAAEI